MPYSLDLKTAGNEAFPAHPLPTTFPVKPHAFIEGAARMVRVTPVHSISFDDRE